MLLKDNHEHQPWEPNTLQTKHVNVEKMSCKYKSARCRLPDSVREQSNVFTGQEKSKYWPQIPVGSIRTATSSDYHWHWSSRWFFYVWWLINFSSIQCQIMYMPGKFKPSTHIFSLELTSRIFWCFCFSSFLFLEIRLWPPLSPERCCSICSGLLLISAGRVAGVISVRCLRVLTDHVPLFNDTLSHLILRAIRPQICMTECLLLLFIDFTTHSCALCCQRRMSGEANSLIDGQYCSVAHKPGACSRLRLKQPNSLREMTSDQDGVPQTLSRKLLGLKEKTCKQLLFHFI